MMKLEADIVVMTMPDIETYHIKRSYYKKDIEYIFLPHDQGSSNLTLRPEATIHYDTIFTTGKHQRDEELAFDKMYNVKRNIVEAGFPLLDDMINDYKEVNNKEKVVLIAPSWQKDNIIDLCLDELLDKLKDNDYKVIVRPHPQQVRHAKERFEILKKKYSENDSIVIQTDFSATNTVFESDLVITDWSGIAMEFSFTTKKPVLFIDTPMKVMNPNYKELNIEPINIWIREKIGKVIDLNDLSNVDKVVSDMLKSKKEYQKSITKIVDEYVFNLGNSAEVEAKYIIESLQNKVKERKNEK